MADRVTVISTTNKVKINSIIIIKFT